MGTQRQQILSLLRTSPTLIRNCRYRRFGSTHGNVLVIASGYHLVSDCARAFLSQQWGVKLLQLHPIDTFLMRFVEAVAVHKPDFLFTVNHLGFDNDGMFARILEEIEMPFVSWFVDQPEFILLDHLNNASGWGITPVWDKAGLDFLRRFGFGQSFFLPLAASSERHSMARLTDTYKYKVSFVGDSLEAGAKKWRLRCESETDLADLIEPVVEKLLLDRAKSPIELARKIRGENSDLLGNSPAHHWAIFSSAVCKEASRRQRQAMVEAFSDEELDVFGDEGWENIVSDPSRSHPPVDYNEDLFSVYRASMVNLNTTNFQMSSAVNQRVFDVPMSGGFLLTDHQADLDELFDVDNEVVSYSSYDEALEKARYFQRNAKKREMVINSARARIIAEHTFDKRIAMILSHVHELYRQMCGAMAETF